MLGFVCFVKYESKVRAEAESDGGTTTKMRLLVGSHQRGRQEGTEEKGTFRSVCVGVGRNIRIHGRGESGRKEAREVTV